MQRVFILPDSEADGTCSGDLTEIINLEEIENPRCPLCGAGTLLAYTEEGEYNVLTWYCLTDEDAAARPDAWYLICQELACTYEEQVERVHSPVGAVIFDQFMAHSEFDEETGLIDRHPAAMKELIAYLEELKQDQPHRKLDAFLDEARWRYEDELAQLHKWLERIPAGRKIELELDGTWIEATCMAVSADTLLVRTLPGGEVMGVNVEEIGGYLPRRFDTVEQPKSETNLKNGNWITVRPPLECVVVKGYHLRVDCVDRLGQYAVRTADPEAGKALGLKEKNQGYWTGYLRRSQIEARYDIRKMVKVKGHWVRVDGETMAHWPHVCTEDPAAAAALGLGPVRSFWPDERETRPLVERWSGVISPDDVEERDEVRIYLWPIPELK